MKHWKKVIVALLALALALTFAACTKTPGEDATTTTTRDAASAANGDPSTALPTDTTDEPTGDPSASNTTTTDGTTGDSPSSTNATSQTKTDAYKVFNDAVAKGKPTKAVYNRIATAVVFDVGTGIANNFVNDYATPEVIAMQNGSNLTANAGVFTTISASDCSSAEIKDNGSSYSVTFKLKSAQVAATSKPAKNGYMYFMDATEVKAAFSLANNTIPMSDSGTISLSKGVLSADVNKATGKLTAAKLTLTETYNGKMDLESIEGSASIIKYLHDNPTGTFTYDLTVNYSF